MTERLTWAEWKRREDEPRRRMRIDLQAIRRALNAALNTSEGVDFADDEREIMAYDLARVRTRLEQFEQMLRHRSP